MERLPGKSKTAADRVAVPELAKNPVAESWNQSPVRLLEQ
jgi:hypothetical protein